VNPGKNMPPMGLIINPTKSDTMPTIPPATGPSIIPAIIKGTFPNPILSAGNPPKGIMYEKNRVRIILAAASNAALTTTCVLILFFDPDCLIKKLSLHVISLLLHYYSGEHNNATADAVKHRRSLDLSFKDNFPFLNT
jgi:hypothetical protein